MQWKEGTLLVVAVLVAGIARLSSAQPGSGTIDNNSTACDDQCQAGEYLSIPPSETDCLNVCYTDDMAMGGSGGASGDRMDTITECLACHDSCMTCYGPGSHQCYSCPNYYITINPAQSATSTESNSSLDCTNGTIRNTSLEVRQCVSNCSSSPGFTVREGTLECVCSSGYYPSIDGSSCSRCPENCSVCVNGTQIGCLRCSVVMHGGQCLNECPSDLRNVNGFCEKPNQNDLFPFDRVALFTIIGAIGFVILFFVFWIFCITVTCLCRQRGRTKYKVQDDLEHGGTTISESFKKVKRNFSIKRRPLPPNPTSTSSLNSDHEHHNRRDIVSRQYDPYETSSAIAGVELLTNEPAINQYNEKPIELSSHKPPPPITNEAEHEEEEEEEEFYTDMTTTAAALVSSDTSLDRTRSHKPLGFTQSYEPPRNIPVKSSVQRKVSFPLQPQPMVDEEQEIYVNPQSDDDGDSQENYVAMEPGGDVYEAEEYMVPSEIRSGNNSQVPPDEDGFEQELYTEMNVVPPVPQRAVVMPPVTARRKEKEPTKTGTLDNQYVKITGQDKQLKAYLSDEKLAVDPKYVNVQRSGDPRLRSITSPTMTGGLASGKRSSRVSNVNDNLVDEDESYYGNIS